MKINRSKLTALLLAVFLGSMGMMLYYRWQDMQSEQIYQMAEQVAGVGVKEIVPEANAVPEKAPEQESPAQEYDWGQSFLEDVRDLPIEEEILDVFVPLTEKPGDQPLQLLQDQNAASLLSIDIAALQKVNQDVLGWIMIPGTNISYPLLQGEDNEYYLNHTWDNQKKYVGSVFLEHQNSSDLTDFNTIIYGHNLVNQTMLSQLHLYKKQSFWEKYPYVYIVTEAGAFRYQIYAAYEVPTDARAYRLRFDENERQYILFANDGAKRSVLDTGITPTPQDRVLTFSTCTGVIKENRWVVQAVLEGQLIDPANVENETIELREE